jgi:hypothetical protein
MYRLTPALSSDPDQDHDTFRQAYPLVNVDYSFRNKPNEHAVYCNVTVSLTAEPPELTKNHLFEEHFHDSPDIP